MKKYYSQKFQNVPPRVPGVPNSLSLSLSLSLSRSLSAPPPHPENSLSACRAHAQTAPRLMEALRDAQEGKMITRHLPPGGGGYGWDLAQVKN